jgi:hypothetical protein
MSCATGWTSPVTIPTRPSGPSAKRDDAAQIFVRQPDECFRRHHDHAAPPRPHAIPDGAGELRIGIALMIGLTGAARADAKGAGGVQVKFRLDSTPQLPSRAVSSRAPAPRPFFVMQGGKLLRKLTRPSNLTGEGADLPCMRRPTTCLAPDQDRYGVKIL